MNPISKLPIPLLEWYRDNARTLPWRTNPTPYRVWVSEIMLQQTRVTAVLGYFERFMSALPTPADLAAVPEDQLLKLWQGLGYYSRARNLQKAARQIMTEYGGRFPETLPELRRLAGVGDYTAAAIASIAFGGPYPAVDGNLLRVTARITGDHGDITTPAMKKTVTELLTEIIPVKAPGAFNQAMMDLGAMVCLPNGAPLCDRCPAASFCLAHEQGLEMALPVRSRKKPRRIEERTVFFLFHQGQVALRRRPSKGLLAGLWEPPCEPSADAPFLLDRWGFTPLTPALAGTARHIFTHVEWHMEAYVLEAKTPYLPPDWVWADGEAVRHQYAIPAAFAGFSDILAQHLTY